MIFHTILPLVLPLTAQPSARLEAEDTLPPFFIIGRPGLVGCWIVGAGLGLVLIREDGIGAGLPTGTCAGAPVTVCLTPGLVLIREDGIGAGLPTGTCAKAPVTVCLTPGLEGAAGNGLAGTFPGAYLII